MLTEFWNYLNEGPYDEQEFLEAAREVMNCVSLVAEVEEDLVVELEGLYMDLEHWVQGDKTVFDSSFDSLREHLHYLVEETL